MIPLYTFIRDPKTGSYIARCAHPATTNAHVLYADKDGELRDGVTYTTRMYGYEENDGLPVLHRDQNGVYR